MRRALIALTVAGALAVPAVAEATIVPQRSIAGVRLGMSEAAVRAALGEPSRATRGRNDFGPYTELVYRRLRLRVLLQGRQAVTAVSTTSRAERTRSGVGVGSSERAVRRGVRGVRCESVGSARQCVVGREEPGRRVTAFMIRRGVVARVTLGIVID